MNDISYQGQDNMGGLTRYIRLAPTTWLDTATDTDQTNTHAAALTPDHAGRIQQARFVAAREWLNLYITDDSGDLQQEQRHEGGNAIWLLSLVAFHPAPVQYKAYTIQQLALLPLVAEVQDAQGRWRRMGSLATPARMVYTEATGAQAAQRAGYTITLRSTSDAPAPYVQEPDASGSGSGN